MATSELADLERQAIAAYLAGHDGESDRAWEQAHLAYQAAGDADRAAQCAFWLAIGLVLRGEMARAGGWVARAQRLVESEGDCVARGLLDIPAFLEAISTGDAKSALTLATAEVETARRLGNHPDLLAFGLLGQGQASLALGRTAEGMKLLDEVMVSVTTGELSPITAGIVYCAVIEACMDTFDVRRAAAWTAALSDWCAARPDLVPYRGQCLVHRSQVLQARGDWGEAELEAERARVRLSQPTHPALGLALYQQGELHRVRGEFAAAERAYRSASQHGREPVPGFALLRLAEGKVDAAVVAINRMVAEGRGRLGFAATLAAAVEVFLAAGDVAAARQASEELSGLAGPGEAPFLHALAAFAAGSVFVADGDAGRALPALRRAAEVWRELDMPYDVGRARVQIGVACRALGDADAAGIEFDAARVEFERLGAHADLARLEAIAGRPGRETLLSDREREVLRLVAAGKSNRDIAAELTISEHTVARHLQNMFVKLGVSSRAAATAYAYEHGLV